jgi:D-glycero-D-manno-heptose 1,7-bisphosphate phosphatase
MRNKALFLDRDGVVNIDYAFVHQQQNFTFVEGIFELCHYFTNRNYQIFIITNQSGIGRGFYTEQTFQKLMQWVSAEFLKRAIVIQKSYYCPHHPIEGIGIYKRHCDCRKPKAGMLFKAAKEFNLDLSQSLLIGDKLSDIATGKKAKLQHNYLIKSHYQSAYDFSSVTEMIQLLSKK